MNQAKAASIISNAVYAIGTAIALYLVAISLFGSNEITNPDIMLPMTEREWAALWLGWGSIPMLLACLAVYRCNGIRDMAHKRRNGLLVFLPGVVCLVCAIPMIGLVLWQMVAVFTASFR